MQSILIVIHLLVVVAMVGVVLLQRSEGGALGIGGGGGGGGAGFMTGRGAANALTRATAFLAVAFFATSIMLTILSRGAGTGTSIIDDAAGTAVPTAPQSSEGGLGGDGQGILNQLEQLQDQSGPQVPQSQ